MSELICENLAIGYDGRVVKNGINFRIEHGDYLCIVGENGSGKSTLMKTILGLQPSIDGQVIFDDSLKMGEIGYLPQQTAIQKDFPASVREIILSGCQNHCGIRPFYNRTEKRYAGKIMEKLQITELSDKSYRELSGGQQQRVLLARALCATKKMLFLDEPVSGLDPKVTFEMYDILKEINKREKITIVMISHDIDAVLNYAGNVLYLGKNNFFGTKNEYMDSGIISNLER